MASYSDWNQAISDYFTSGLTPGDTCYLSVDEDALVEIGNYSLDQTIEGDAVGDFETALRATCVVRGEVILPSTTQRPEHTAPPYIAFLGAMVLAAYRMAPEDNVAEINYFTRLREILGIPGPRGRPPGLTAPGAPEERLWISLNAWISNSNWQPSAQRGPDGPMKFTNYPLSQSLLRTGDKGKLERDFRDSDLGKDSDREKVTAWFFNRAGNLATYHIRRLAQEATSDRYETIADAVYDVYSSIDWNLDSRTTGAWHAPRSLVAGLYRAFDPLFDNTTYHLFPRRRHRGSAAMLSVVRDGRPESLHRDRDGQYRPLWPVSPDGGETYAVSGDPRIKELHLPSRTFWILTRDRYDETSGVFASRGSPRLGETFLLLCRKAIEHEQQLYTLRDEGLLDWDGDPADLPAYGQWVEYRECMVLSASWEGIIPKVPELFDELRPRTSLSISLQGGLKIGVGDTWLVGYMPGLFVTSFDPGCRVIVTEIAEPEAGPAMDDMVESNSLIGLPNLTAGDYLVRVIGSGRYSMDRRHIRVMSWDALEPSNAISGFGTRVGEHVLHGALLTRIQSTGGDEGV